ncbi:MAG: hypothetical protein ACI8P0_004448, partial [Planctomycetaceae bacterium]
MAKTWTAAERNVVRPVLSRQGKTRHHEPFDGSE